MTPWLTIVGIGEDGWEGLTASARQSVEHARHVIGSTRTLAMVPKNNAKHHLWPQPFSAVVEQITALQGEATVLLATGDPMNFGVARKILEFIPKSEIEIIPHFSAFTLAAANMGWSLPDCDCLTIHGRPASNLEVFVHPEARLLVLTQDETSVAEVCRRLMARGFERSDITVLENLGGPQARVTTFAANANPELAWSPLNILAIHCIASPHAKIWSRVPGLPDDAFEHDGQITKREIRAATLAALAPCPDQILWDVGAGSGSVAIEWCRAARGTMAHAIEPDPQRQKFIARNADRLGAARLFISNGKAPEAYTGLPRPHAVFIGGGISVAGTFEQAWEALLPGGRVVANVVTLEGEMHLYDLQEKHAGEIVRMETSVLTKVGPYRALKPRMAVTQWRVTKPW
jgi:precorrin-6B C5,15-methyltransferase / cobalt-precorrin-6B C5,C15-methyltransferase